MVCLQIQAITWVGGSGSKILLISQDKLQLKIFLEIIHSLQVSIFSIFLNKKNRFLTMQAVKFKDDLIWFS